MKKLTLTFALALLGTAAMNTGASAAATAGDFILGFQEAVSTDPGGTSDVEVDLGNISHFTSLAGGVTVNLTTGSTTAGQTGAFSISDLSNTYTTGLTAGTVYLAGIGNVGTGNATSETFFATVPDGAGPVITTANNQTANSSKVTGMIAGFTLGSGAAGSTDDIRSNGSNSYTAEMGQGVNEKWSLGNFSFNTVQVQYSDTGSVVFDLYELPTTANGTTQELGFFTLYGANDTDGTFAAGSLTFTSTVPEPSTYALMGLGLLGLVGLRRWMALNA